MRLHRVTFHVRSAQAFVQLGLETEVLGKGPSKIIKHCWKILELHGGLVRWENHRTKSLTRGDQNPPIRCTTPSFLCSQTVCIVCSQIESSCLAMFMTDPLFERFAIENHSEIHVEDIPIVCMAIFHGLAVDYILPIEPLRIPPLVTKY